VIHPRVTFRDSFLAAAAVTFALVVMFVVLLVLVVLKMFVGSLRTLITGRPSKRPCRGGSALVAGSRQRSSGLGAEGSRPPPTQSGASVDETLARP
jgi:hypothetical protein